MINHLRVLGIGKRKQSNLTTLKVRLFVETRTTVYTSETGGGGVECFTAKEVARLLSVSRKVVYGLARRQRLPVCCYCGKVALFACSDVEVMMLKRGLLNW